MSLPSARRFLLLTWADSASLGRSPELLYYAHGCEEAIERFRAALELDADYAGAYIWLGLAHQEEDIKAEGGSPEHHQTH